MQSKSFSIVFVLNKLLTYSMVNFLKHRLHYHSTCCNYSFRNELCEICVVVEHNVFFFLKNCWLLEEAVFLLLFYDDCLIVIFFNVFSVLHTVFL